jgi:hypothetical protein
MEVSLYSVASRSFLSNGFEGWALSLGVNLPGHEADHSPPSSATVHKALTTLTSSWNDGKLIKHKNILLFYIIFTLP